MTVRYRYDGTFPIIYLVILHLMSQDFRIMSTCAFVNMRKYPRYLGLLGRIRKNGGFDIIAYHKLDAKELPIGIEVKPELSYIEFKHALGQTIADLTFAVGSVREAMIIMPHKNLAAEDPLKSKINHVLNNCEAHVSVKYLSIPCRYYHG